MITALFLELKKAMGPKGPNGMKRRTGSLYRPSKERASYVQDRMAKDPFDRLDRQLGAKR